MPKTSKKNSLVFKVKSNDVSKEVPVKSNDVSDVSKKVTFEKTSEGYPIARTKSGTVIVQDPKLLAKREEVKGTHFVLNPQIKPDEAEYPIDPNNFWTSSDIRNAKKEFKLEAEAELRRQIKKENCLYDSYSDDSDDSYSDDSYSKNSNTKNSNTDDSNTKKPNCTICGGRSQKRRQRSQKIRRRNKKTHRHRKK